MPQNGPIILRIAVPSPLRRTFDYKLPEKLRSKIDHQTPLAGMRVKVEFGRRVLIGLVVDIPKTSDLPLEKIKDISDIIDSSPIVPSDLFSLFIWAANYYQHPLGEALFTALPSLIRKGEPAVASGIKHWQLTELGAQLDPQTLQRAPKQQALIDFIAQHSNCIEESKISALFSSAIRNQLQQKGLLESVVLENRPLASAQGSIG